MRVNCLLSIQSWTTHDTRRPTKGTISIGSHKTSLGENEVQLCAATVQNAPGRVFMVEGNIERVFAKFLIDGKLTLRLKCPPCDIIISNADPLQLSSFLKVLKMVLRGNVDNVHPLMPVSQVQLQGMQSKMTISSHKQYPRSKPFPVRLQHLNIKCGLKHIESRICNLQHLTALLLNNNSITQLPDTMPPSLRELSLASNKLQGIPHTLCQHLLKRCKLVNLDLSMNQLTEFPSCLWRLKSLYCLNLAGNNLRSIPALLAVMENLCVLDISKNELYSLPYSLFCRKFEHLSVSPFRECQHEPPNVLMSLELSVLSLQEFCMRTIFRCESLLEMVYCLPLQLQTILNSPVFCLCRKWCWMVSLCYGYFGRRRFCADTLTVVTEACCSRGYLHDNFCIETGQCGAVRCTDFECQYYSTLDR